jgi:hypothetical protein
MGTYNASGELRNRDPSSNYKVPTQGLIHCKSKIYNKKYNKKEKKPYLHSSITL